VHVYLYGCGNVGGHLLSMVSERHAAIAERDGVDLRVAAISNRRGTWLDPAGLDLARFRETPARPVDAPGTIDALARLPVPVFVDCSAAPDAAALYEHAFRAGVSVVTANKLPLVQPLAEHRQLLCAQRASARGFFYETTVGADLPVLAPIADRIRSGDRITRIEGSLSGTLGFLSDKIARGVDLEAALTDAQARGYTEPDPGEDLSGRDVARKALILAREIGLAVSADDVALEPFIAAELLELAGSRGLASVLARASDGLDATVRDAHASGRTLRYLAVIDPAAARPVRVGPSLVPNEHPAATLRGTEALVALTTERSAPYAVVIRGPGAGGAVTASGVLADIVRAASAR